MPHAYFGPSASRKNKLRQDTDRLGYYFNALVKDSGWQFVWSRRTVTAEAHRCVLRYFGNRLLSSVCWGHHSCDVCFTSSSSLYFELKASAR